MQNPTQTLRRAEGRHTNSARTYQGIPTIAVTRGGRLWAAFYSGGSGEGKDNFVVLFRSDDGGETWGEPVFAVDPADPSTRAFDECLWVDSDNVLHLFWAQSTSPDNETIFDGVGGVWTSELANPDAPDEDWNWTAPRRIAEGIMLNKPTVLRDGVWALPCAVWNQQGQLGNHLPEMQPYIGAGLVASADKGRSFTFRGRARVVKHFMFDEHQFVELRDGTIRVWIRTQYGYAESDSPDGGYNWTPPVRSAIPGPNSRLFIRRLASGRLLLVRHQVADPAAWAPGGELYGLREKLTAYLSDDDGATWYGGLVLDERKMVSYPDGDQGADGMLYVVYDYDRYGSGDILLARFTEEDVAAGTPVSPRSRLRMPVSHTGGNPPVPRVP